MSTGRIRRGATAEVRTLPRTAAETKRDQGLLVTGPAEAKMRTATIGMGSQDGDSGDCCCRQRNCGIRWNLTVRTTNWRDPVGQKKPPVAPMTFVRNYSKLPRTKHARSCSASVAPVSRALGSVVRRKVRRTCSLTESKGMAIVVVGPSVRRKTQVEEDSLRSGSSNATSPPLLNNLHRHESKINQTVRVRITDSIN